MWSGHVTEPCWTSAVLCALLSKREWASLGECAGPSSVSVQKGL